MLLSAQLIRLQISMNHVQNSKFNILKNLLGKTLGVMKKLLPLFIFFILITPVFGETILETVPVIPGEEEAGQNPPVVEPGQPAGNFDPFPTVNGVPVDEQLPGMPGGGTQNTGVLNNTGVLEGNGSNSGNVTPQSGSAELRQCSSIQFKSLLDILIWIKCIIVVAVIPFIFAAAFVLFLWGVLKFIAATDAPKREEGKKFIVNGLIALFVMVSIWGIISIIGTTLGTKSTVPMLQTTYLK